MLILKRKVGESVELSGGIKIIVNRVQGGAVSLAFVAPDDVTIHRSEVIDRIEQEQRQEQPRLPLRRTHGKALATGGRM